jgi:hypothetical protein
MDMDQNRLLLDATDWVKNIVGSCHSVGLRMLGFDVAVAAA